MHVVVLPLGYMYTLGWRYHVPVVNSCLGRDLVFCPFPRQYNRDVLTTGELSLSDIAAVMSVVPHQ